MEFMQKVRGQVASGPPVLGAHLLMGEKAQLMLKNVGTAIATGVLTPVEIVAVVP